MFVSSSSSSTSWIRFTTSSITETSDLVIIFANNIESSILSSDLSTAFWINLFIWVCSSFSKLIDSLDWRVATEDKICNEIFEFRSCSSVSWMLSIINSITKISDLVITFASSAESSLLSWAWLMASRIKRFTSVCFSISKLIESLFWIVATLERTFNDLFDSSSPS